MALYQNYSGSSKNLVANSTLKLFSNTEIDIVVVRKQAICDLTEVEIKWARARVSHLFYTSLCRRVPIREQSSDETIQVWEGDDSSTHERPPPNPPRRKMWERANFAGSSKRMGMCSRATSTNISEEEGKKRVFFIMRVKTCAALNCESKSKNHQNFHHQKRSCVS